MRKTRVACKTFDIVTVERRDGDERDVSGRHIRLELLREEKAAEPGQDEIDQHQVGLEKRSDGKGLWSVCGHSNDSPIERERDEQELGALDIVFDDQDARACQRRAGSFVRVGARSPCVGAGGYIELTEARLSPVR